MKSFLVLLLILALLMAGCGSPAPAAQNSGFTFAYNNCEIQLNTDAAPVIAALGEPKNYTEEASCAFDGLDKTYFYGSFYLSTYPQEGRDYVYSIWFVDDSVTTEEGIRIGSTHSEVEAAYGPDCINGTNAFTVTKDNTKLTVILTDGAVSSIQYTVIPE